jgi:hypothetical protein
VKLLYKPVGILVSILGGMLAGEAFRRIWSFAGSDGELPKAKDRSRGFTEVVVGAALHGAIFGGIKAFADRAGATGYERATGVWPGKNDSA